MQERKGARGGARLGMGRSVDVVAMLVFTISTQGLYNAGPLVSQHE